MRQKLSLASLILLAVLLWFSLILFMNRRPPDALNQIIFLVIWGGAVACSMVPPAYALNVRFSATWNRDGAMGRALRQGALIGLLAAALMALRFMRFLNALSAIVLVTLVVTVEVLILLRSR